MPLALEKTNIRNSEVKNESSIGNLNAGIGNIAEDEGSGFFDHRTGKRRSLTDDS